MRAFKQRYEWLIPVTATVNWLDDRDDIPDWTKRTIKQYEQG
jgi:hypothetical protein